MISTLVEPVVVYPNGDLLYIAKTGKLLLQVETKLTFKRAYEPANGKHHQYEEVDENEAR